MKNTTTGALAFLGAMLTIFITSCVKDIDDFQTPAPAAQGPITSMEQLAVPEGFHYDSDRKTNLNIRILDAVDQPIQGVRINIMNKTTEEGGVSYYTGGSDANGYITGEARFPGNLQQVIIVTDYAGVMNNVVASLSGTTLSCVIGGSNPQSVSADNRMSQSTSSLHSYGSSANKGAAVPTITTLGTWNSKGLPNYLSTPNDIISTAFSQRINASLPNSKVTVHHPAWLTSPSTITLSADADVYVTFFHENTTLKNTIAYYVYNKATPPSTVAQIPTIKVVFPNLSYTTAGAMIAGHKVKIGNFKKDDVVAFVLLTGSFNAPNVTNGTNQFYTNDALNPEGNASLKRHNVALFDIVEKKVVMGWEETLRTKAGADHDFNDQITIVSTVPSSAITSTGMATTINNTDSDGDGVLDVLDEFPTNASMAYSSPYPTSDPNVYGHLAFEDLWPARGDYDLNDLIIGYRFTEFKNAANRVVKIDGKFYVDAAGGSYKHGFGFALPVSQSVVTSATGSVIHENYISLNAKGLENGQSKVSMIVFDNSHKTINQPIGFFINTQQGAPVSVGDSIPISITFSVPQTPAQIGSPPYNPFIISNMRRGYEIHLPDMAPTDLVNTALFNTMQDSTNVAAGRYYKTNKNIPWAINIPGSYGIVLEKNKILDAYLNFPKWAQSAGTTYTDWYEDKPGYRDPSKIFSGK